MIQDINTTIVAKLATYFQVSDLISLSQVSPYMRHHFSQYSCSKLFVIPHKFFNSGTGTSFKMYQYFVITEDMLIKASNYQWIKRNHVRELVLSPMCNLMKPETIAQINIKASFPYLQSIHVEAHHTIKTKDNIIGFGPGSSLVPLSDFSVGVVIIKQYRDSFTYQKPSMLLDQVLSTVPQSLQIANLLFEDERLFNITSNLSTLSSLQLSHVNKCSDFTKLIDSLSLCVNLERFEFMPLMGLKKSKYLLLYSVINKRFLKLKQLKMMYYYNITNHSHFTTIQEMSNRRLEYFEVSIKFVRDSCCTYSESEARNERANLHVANIGKKINLSGVHGLELLGDHLRNDALTLPKFRKRLHAPDLRHFKSRMFIVDHYLRYILFPVKNTLVTLNVGVMEWSNLSLFLSCLPKFKNLKNLVIEHRDYISDFFNDTHPSELNYMAQYPMNRYACDRICCQIRDASIGFDKIQKLRDSDVKKLVVDILQKEDIGVFEEDRNFIDTMVKLIKRPEHLVRWCDVYGIIYFGWGTTRKDYSLPIMYCFWDSIYNICKNLTKLEVLKMVQKSVPFISPHFSSFVHNHKSDRLKFVAIDIIGRYSEWISPEEINKLTYGQYVYKIKAPFVYKYMEPYMGVIDYVGELYMVDTEALRNKFGVSKNFRKEEMEYSSSYLGSSFKVKNIKKHQEVMTGLTKELRLSIIGPKDIRNTAVNLNNRYEYN